MIILYQFLLLLLLLIEVPQNWIII